MKSLSRLDDGWYRRGFAAAPSATSPYIAATSRSIVRSIRRVRL